MIRPFRTDIFPLPYVLVGVLWLCFGSQLSGQSPFQRIAFERFDRRAELPYSYLNGMLEDEQGYLWIGSGQQGVLRYDGLEFRPFPMKGNVFSIDLRFGSRHGLWSLNGDGDLQRYVPHQEEFVASNPRLAGQSTNERLSDLRELRDGSLWAITTAGQLCRFDPATALLTPEPLELPNGRPLRAWRLGEAPDGRLWVTTASTLLGLQREADRWVVAQTFETAYIAPNILNLDRRGRIWLAGGDNQVLCYDPARGRAERFDLTPADASPAATYRINDLFFAPDGRVWIATNNSGICLLDPATGRTEQLRYDRNDPQSLSGNNIQSIVQDRSGTIWVSSWGGGLNRFRPANQFFQHYRSLPNASGTLSHPEPNCFYATTDGSVWIGTRDGLNRLEPATGRIESFFLPRQLTGNREVPIYALNQVADNPDQLWVATAAGLFRFDKPTQRFTRWAARTGNEPLATRTVYNLVRDARQNLWAICFVGGEVGYRLYRFAPAEGAFVEIDPLPARHPERGKIIFHSLQGETLWIDTPDSVFYAYDLALDSLTRYELSPTDASGFNTAQVGLPLRDRRGRLWFGTENGLLRMLPAAAGEPVRFREYTEADGLVNAAIKSLVLDERGRVWIGTVDGLSCFDPETEQFVNFKTRDGIQSDEFNYNAAYRHPGTGQLFLGGRNGFNVWQPDRLPRDTVAPAVALTRIEVLKNGEMTAVPVYTPAYRPIPTLELAAGEKIVRFEFAALHFADPDRNQYAYQLEGFDTEWRYVGGRREATYTNLDPGYYRLRVKAANQDGTWNESGATLALRVLPPWWATGWAFLFYALTLGSAATWLYLARQRRRRVRAEARRIKELDRFKSQFYTNITHEFRTPLTVILGMARQLRDHPEKYLDSGTHLIERNGRQLLRLINQLLDLSKLENKAFPLHWQRGDIVPFLRYLTESFASYATERELDLRFAADPASLEMDYDPEQLQQVMTNLIGNALKFTPSGGRVAVRLRATDASLAITVRDTGIGIPAADLPYIFDRFYQVNRKRNPLGGGTGIGLAHTRSLAQLMGGEVSVASQPKKGAVFTVTLPIHREAPRIAAPPRVDTSAVGLEPATVNVPNTAEDEPADTRPELLLIEDNADVVTYLQTCLADRYRCRVAPNGRIGIERALDSVPDLIISDVMMPERDGFEVCDTLKNDPRTSHIPIILLTARADAASRLAGLRRGADAYLAKPFDRAELLVRIDRLLRRQEQLAAYFSRRLRAEPTDPPATDLPAADLAVEDGFVRRVREIVAEYYTDENFALPELCRAIGMSRSQLYRKLRALCGISPSDFIRSYRMERARELLADSDLNVSEVAWRVGYRDPSYFTKSFQDAFGYLPSAGNSPKTEN